jgi:hypothetical protein
MADHDQRFKTLRREFFVEFLRLFYPAWAARFDLTRLEWLDKEVFTDPPQGQRREVDLAVRLPLLQPVAAQGPGESDADAAILHVEVESADKVAPLRSRLYEYYEHLRRKYRLPVWSTGLFLRVGLEGLGVDAFEERLWEDEVLRFLYRYVGLPALDAETYLAGDNWLAVALSALMRIAPERRGWLKAEALRRLVACPENEYRRFLLCECVEAYLPLEGPQLQDYERLLLTEPYKEIGPMTTTWFERGVEHGERKLLRTVLESRFGALTPRAQEKLASWSVDKLDEIARAVGTAHSLQELGLED